jgi:Hint domain-containing protein
VIAGVNRMPSTPPACPICLAIGTRIATPSGDVPVEDLRLGDFIWTLDAGGARVAVALVAVGRAPVPPAHEVTRLVLSDGRALDVSPGHPDAAGRAVGKLVAGDPYDGAVVVSADRVRYDGGATFDVRPAGDTGLYWANGVLLASTLRGYSPSIAASSAALFTALSP